MTRTNELKREIRRSAAETIRLMRQLEAEYTLQASDDTISAFKYNNLVASLSWLYDREVELIHLSENIYSMTE